MRCGKCAKCVRTFLDPSHQNDGHECEKEYEFARLIVERVEEKRKIAKGPENCLEIQVLLPTGRQIAIVVLKTGRVGDLKRMIFHKTSIPPSEQKLYFAGKIFDQDHMLLSKTALRWRSTVTLVVPTKGGV
jgi:hypothetical protein